MKRVKIDMGQTQMPGVERGTDKRRLRNRELTTTERRKLWEMFGGRCHLCGDPVDFTRKEFWPDHVWQRRKPGPNGEEGGPDTLENQLPAHWDCNAWRGVCTREQFVRRMRNGALGQVPLPLSEEVA
jgi:hypothetical protein